MKKLALCIACIFAVSLMLSVAVQAQTKPAACDPKKIEECCSKIDTFMADLDTLKAKLGKMQADMKQGKAVSDDQVTGIIKKMDEVESAMSIDAPIWTDY